MTFKKEKNHIRFAWFEFGLNGKETRRSINKKEESRR